MRHGAGRCGLVLVELAAALVVVVILAALLLTASADARRQASLGDDLANLKGYGEATGAYGADNDDRIWGFSWRMGVNYGFGGVAATDTEAAANQAVDIIRRRTGRTDIARIPGWLPNPIYSTLVLADYMDELLPSRSVASAEDHLRLLWQSDPEEGFYTLGPDQRPGSGAANNEKRWPYSSSYELPAAFWSRDAADASGPTVGIGTLAHWSYHVPNGSLVMRRLSEVRHPGQKAMLFDQYQRHFGPRRAYVCYPEARVPVLAVDGSAAVRLTSEANQGFNPNSPTLPVTTQMTYSPAQWEPAPLSGNSGDTVRGYYRWTRSGLRGRDFGGPEVPWLP